MMVNEIKQLKKDRKGERGAALVMALLISFLLLAASAGLILETSINASHITDATSEQQAYNAAESGIQSFVDVMRFKCTAAVSPCRVAPSPLFNTALADYHKDNKISFSKAVSLDTSNLSTDASTTSRLSRVLSYTGTGAADPAKLGQPSDAYVRQSGFAYNISITDPDNTGSLISYYTSGMFFDHDMGNSQQITFPEGGGANSLSIRYNPTIVSNLNVPGGTVQSTDFGNFTVTLNGTGARVDRLIRFEIHVQMTVPYPATRTIRGYVEPIAETTYVDGKVPLVIFDSQTYNLRGSEFSLQLGPWPAAPEATMRMTGNSVDDPDGVYRSDGPFGYEARMSAGTNALQGLISPPEPARLRVLSTGFGPRGSVKTLEAIIQNNYFNGLGAPATLTMVGPPNASNGDSYFNPGNSNTMIYSGQDAASGSLDIIPPVGVTHPPDCSSGTVCEDINLDRVIAGFGSKISNTVIGTPSNVNGENPPWLQSPQALDATVQSLFQTALNSYDSVNPTGRVFTNTDPTSWGDNATGTGITFCDGDCTLGPIAGGGILVVTGQLTLHGNFNWNGLIIVTGGQDPTVLRDGGGTGTIQGNIIVAPYANSRVGDNSALDPLATFLAPQWDTRGGGNSNIVYNSDNQNSGLGAISNVVLGVVEK